MKLLPIIFVLAYLQGCTTTPNSVEQSIELPATSIVKIAPTLASDVIGNIRTYIEKNYQCSDWQVLSAKEVSSEGDIIMTGKGQLYSGVISETWTVNQCGVNVELGIVMKSDGKGGSLVGVTKL